MKLVFFLSYNGKGYHGFQKQPGVRTVQGELEKALINLFPKLTSIGFPLSQGAGRTDAGVHGSEQVLAVKVSPCVLNQVQKISLTKLPQVINTILPDEINIFSVFLADRSDGDFNPRYRTKVRCYRYQILQTSVSSGFLFGHSGLTYSPGPPDISHYYLIPFNLDLSLLGEYFSVFEGRHDFASFTSWDNNHPKHKFIKSRKNTLRTIYRIDLIPRGKEVWIDIYGDSFLKSMVRSLIGNVLYHYRKGNPPELLRKILLAKDASQAKHRAPAHSLFLRRIFFNPIFGNESIDRILIK